MDLGRVGPGVLFIDTLAGQTEHKQTFFQKALGCSSPVLLWHNCWNWSGLSLGVPRQPMPRSPWLDGLELEQEQIYTRPPRALY